MADPRTPHEPESGSTYELRDAQIRPVVVFLVVLGLLVVVSFVSMVWLFNYLDSREAARDVAPSPLAEGRQLPPEPRLQATSSGELETVQSSDLERLEGYRWVDREAGIVQIPIERAMELIAQRGLPAREGE